MQPNEQKVLTAEQVAEIRARRDTESLDGVLNVVDSRAILASHEALRAENADLRRRLDAAEESFNALDSHWDEIDVLITDAGYGESLPCDKFSIIEAGVRSVIKDRDAARAEAKRLREENEAQANLHLRDSQVIREALRMARIELQRRRNLIGTVLLLLADGDIAESQKVLRLALEPATPFHPELRAAPPATEQAESA